MLSYTQKKKKYIYKYNRIQDVIRKKRLKKIKCINWILFKIKNNLCKQDQESNSIIITM